MNNITPGPDALIDMCRSVVVFADIGREVVEALPIRLEEEDPLAFPEPGLSGTARLGNGEVVGVFYGLATRKLAFFPGDTLITGDPATVEAVLCESGLPVEKVSYRWDVGGG
jgi:hypothetical protein